MSAFRYFAFVAIQVSDIERSLRFYCQGLGFEPVSHLLVEGKSPSAVELGLDHLRTEGYFVQRDGIRIQLQHQALPTSHAYPPIRKQLGLSHFGIRVDDMDAALEQVEKFGGSVPEGHRHRNPQYRSEVARVLDPDGVRMELLKMPGDATELPGEAIEGAG